MTVKTTQEWAQGLDRPAKPRSDAFADAIMALPPGAGRRRARPDQPDFTYNPCGLAGRSRG